MKITEYGITVVYLMILCRIAYADWKYQIIEPWTHIGILTLACMEMLFRVGVSVQERCLGAVRAKFHETPCIITGSMLYSNSTI